MSRVYRSPACTCSCSRNDAAVFSCQGDLLARERFVFSSVRWDTLSDGNQIETSTFTNWLVHNRIVATFSIFEPTGSSCTRSEVWISLWQPGAKCPHAAKYGALD